MKNENNRPFSRQKHININLRFLSLIVAIFVSSVSFATIHEGGDYEAGETSFNNNCATCHSLDGSVLAAPSLKGVAERWEGKDDALVIQWIQNPKKAFATGDPYVVGMANKWIPKFNWMQNQAVSEKEINDILTFVSEYKGPGGDDVIVDGKDWYGEPIEEEGESNPVFWFLILAVMLAIIAVSASGMGRALSSNERETAGLTGLPNISYGERAKNWMWNNKVVVSLVGILFVCFFVVQGYVWAMGINVMSDYRPEQPIKFNHKLHAGKNKIDCQYCHNSASKSKHAGLPEPMLCMNCHKGVKQGSSDEMTAEIQKIYDYVGFDAENGVYLEDYDQEPIVWNKVHNLPDHVFFSHQQHVAVGGLECQNCHGPVDQEYTLGKVATSEEIMALAAEDINIIPLEKDVLTMGWCIECHNKAGIDVMTSENGYYQEIHDRLLESDLGKRDLQKYLKDNTITVKELGGWECSKCHY